MKKARRENRIRAFLPAVILILSLLFLPAFTLAETGAGALTVGVTWGFFPEDKLREAGADEIAFTPADVTRIARI